MYQDRMIHTKQMINSWLHSSILNAVFHADKNPEFLALASSDSPGESGSSHHCAQVEVDETKELLIYVNRDDGIAMLYPLSG